MNVFRFVVAILFLIMNVGYLILGIHSIRIEFYFGAFISVLFFFSEYVMIKNDMFKHI